VSFAREQRPGETTEQYNEYYRKRILFALKTTVVVPGLYPFQTPPVDIVDEIPPSNASTGTGINTVTTGMMPPITLDTYTGSGTSVRNTYESLAHTILSTNKFFKCFIFDDNDRPIGFEKGNVISNFIYAYFQASGNYIGDRAFINMISDNGRFNIDGEYLLVFRNGQVDSSSNLSFEDISELLKVDNRDTAVLFCRNEGAKRLNIGNNTAKDLFDNFLDGYNNFTITMLKRGPLKTQAERNGTT
jgi:hypothetical protein